MLNQLHRVRAVLAAAFAAILCLGFAAPALAEEETYSASDAKLTKVIVAGSKVDASQDTYVFQFAGKGEVREDGDKFYSSDGIEQDATTIKAGDEIPEITDVTLRGVALSDANTLTDGQNYQTVVQKSIASILSDQNVTFPHAGVYTYVVTEKTTSTKLEDGTYINPSLASYKLRIRVVNDSTASQSTSTDPGTVVDGITVEQMKDDNGSDKTGKVDPSYPRTDASGKINYVSEGQTPDANRLAGDERGRFVDGFTFANEYIKGGTFQVKKLYDGAYSDKTLYTWVELTVYSEAAASDDAHGCCVTYRIEGEGIDETESNQDADGERMKLNGVYSNISQVNDYMATFSDKGWAKIKARLKEGSVIRITGEFGPYNPEYATDPTSVDGNKRKILSTSGLLQGQTYYVIERYPGDYMPTGYVYVGENENADPRKNSDGMIATQRLTSDMTDETDPIPDDQPGYAQQTIKAGSLFVEGTATGSATTVFVVNTIDEDKVTPTGIFIDNLPYILMIGIPVAVFAAMFASKRRAHAAA